MSLFFKKISEIKIFWVFLGNLLLIFLLSKMAVTQCHIFVMCGLLHFIFIILNSVTSSWSASGSAGGPSVWNNGLQEGAAAHFWAGQSHNAGSQGKTFMAIYRFIVSYFLSDNPKKLLHKHDIRQCNKSN